MSTRPSRTTRSSAAAAAPTAPAAATRTTRRTTTTTAPPPPSTSAADPLARRTTRASRANTPSAVPEVKVTQTRASMARSAANSQPSSSSTTRPLWSSSRANVSTPPPASATTPQVKRGTSLAVPGSSLRPKTPGSGLIARMTSRESLRQPKTPAPAPAPSRQSVALEHSVENYDGAREPIKAFLRIRPAPPGVPIQSYLQVLNETDVLMVPPMDHRLNPSSSSSSLFSNALLRSSHLHLDTASHPSGTPDDVLASPATNHHVGPDPSTYGSLYKFTSVFPPTSLSSSPSTSSPSAATSQSQKAFFQSTTLPLVRDFLVKGENCLLFAYGPTSSGKTWTVQGGQGDDAGLLPRVVEVVCRSLKGERRPASKMTPPPSRAGPPLTSTPPGAGGPRESLPAKAEDPEVIALSDSFEYSVWVSYSEIYNEKIYDLLEPPVPTTSTSTPAASSHGGGGGMFKSMFRNLTTVKRSALSLKADKSAPATPGGGASQQKVVGGLREVKVLSAEEAHAVLARGQSNRRVFSTLANRASSRSHGIFTIKVVRSSPHTGAEVSTSRFSIVDLAGSERVVNTQTTGERLKEAGNINRSLMVLGQCMEVLRKNQEREKGRKAAIVPFRHSKLTEMFQSFFIGDGKAVMIVNINPYETGYDENSHVMKFSAIAKSVVTTLRRGPDNHVLLAPTPAPAPLPVPAIEKKQVKKKEPRVVRVSLVDGGEEEEVLYEEETDLDDDTDEDEFVGALLDELSTLRTALLEAQMNAVLAVSTARSQLAKEYEAKILAMDREHQRRLREEAVEADTKFNAKLDILTRLQAARTPARGAGAGRASYMTPSTAYDDSDNEEEEDELEGDGGNESGEEEGEGELRDDSEEVRDMLLPGAAGDTSLAESTDSMSPLAARVKHVTMLSPSPLAQSPLSRSPLATDSAMLAADSNVDAAVENLVPVAEADGEPQEQTAAPATAEDEPLVVDEQDELASADEGEIKAASDAEYDPSPVPTPIKDTPSQLSTPRTGGGGGKGKENEAPTPDDAALAEADDDEAYAEADEFGLDKSMVIRSGSKTKKTKRKLGVKVHDVDDLDTIEGILSPIRKTPSATSRSFLKR
ncbi:uncharacterized protein RHOBADRAFT_54059 [Rhodotorula graminis WP1]|uniref:Kinesin motor domain-containing protein n=1 Tax=Rhodotorula graminis (strain WP1) TaxID=578459 RepID=A0A194S0F6_RHOGW|nr:uncharacterized protein RHOBADRAFT_54059 [Rhodotorula graminis WP1]KPV74208.1 hypothetical protein RHOBADRAFT_54059 [Rhodotorula graminis WP1]